jgi:hypothetical protein
MLLEAETSGRQLFRNPLTRGRAMAQIVSRRPLTAEARVRTRVNPCGICGGQSGTGTGFSPSSSVFPCQYIIPPSLSETHIIWRTRNMLTKVGIHAWVLDPPHFQGEKTANCLKSATELIVRAG